MTVLLSNKQQKPLENKNHRNKAKTDIYSEITADSFSLIWSFKQRLKSLKV